MPGNGFAGGKGAESPRETGEHRHRRRCDGNLGPGGAAERRVPI